MQRTSMPIYTESTELLTQPPRYKASDLIGKGNYADVYRGLYGSKAVAIKVIDKSEYTRQEIEVNMHIRKIYDEKRLSVPVAVRYFGHQSQGSCLKMVFDLMEFSLETFIESEAYNDETLFQLARDMIVALAFLHEKANVVHCDIKKENVMIKDNRAYFADFGLATVVVPALRKTRIETWGTPNYMAPELLAFANDNNFASDIWALGLVLFEAVTKRKAFDEYDHLKHPEFIKILNTLDEPIAFQAEEKTRQPLLVKFSLMACKRLPAERPTAQALAEEITKDTEINPIQAEWDTGCGIV